ncbi:MAG: C25 family cysteine peptidase [Calditrichota bacterium]
MGWFQTAQTQTLALASVNPPVALISSDSKRLRLQFQTANLETRIRNAEESNQSEFVRPNEGQTIAYGQPILPMVSRFVVVPLEAGIEFSWTSESPRRIRTEAQPLICDDPNYAPLNQIKDSGMIYPPLAAEMSEPFIIRGVRMVKVTTYPVQYDESRQTYIINDRITTDLHFTGQDPINPVRQPIRKHQSQEFKRFIRALAVNGEDAFRDDPEVEPIYVGHYLIASHENCLQYVAPFIEWRRKSGYKVDILSIPANVARADAAEIKALIQERYNEYLDQGQDPFDQLLLVGDRSHYRQGPTAGWILEADPGEAVEQDSSAHADYKYACLEGDDHYPDVAFSRFCAGADSILELFTGRTLGYEAQPYFGDVGWFTRGGVYSQHWGNLENSSAWHISIPSNLRWAEQMMKARGFNITFFEDYSWDNYGGVVGRIERTMFNEGTNLMLGRVETLYWAEQAPVNDNVVFPVRFTLSGHGEFGLWLLLRTGTGEHLKGPVVASCGWGEPTTIASNAVWLEMVNALVNRNLSWGWSRVLAITISENYFTNFWFVAQQVYYSMKADYDYYGDPGLMPWLSVPRVVQAHFPASLAPETRMIEVSVTDTSDHDPVSGAQVTLYAPGDMPAFEDAEYAAYDRLQMWTKLTDNEGSARFIFAPEVDLSGNAALLVTVTGRDIRPYFGEISLERQDAAIELAAYNLSEQQGNGDGRLNPNETFNLTLTAANLGRAAANGVSASIQSLSPHVSIGGGNPIQFDNIASGGRANGQAGIQLRVSPACPDGSARPATQPILQIDFTVGNSHWISAIKLNPIAPHLTIRAFPQGLIVPSDGELLMDLIVENVGGLIAARFYTRLAALGTGVTVLRDSVSFPPMPAGEHEYCNGDPLRVRGDPRVIPGTKCAMQLAFFTFQNNFSDTAFFELQVGEPHANAPQTPDDYGYICYDDTDSDWMNYPTYDWAEISPVDNDPDYEGTQLNFSGQSAFDVGEAMAVRLPFKTQFYGQVTDTITICTNGYIMPGNQARVVNPQNWPLDRGMGGGVGMIAPFWDWLALQNNSNIYIYYDEPRGRFIVEWYRLRLHTGGQNDLTFQVILYDQARHATETGDPDILFQYKSIENIAGDLPQHQDIPYASVGISSPKCDAGISYTFRNTYPGSSAPLANRRAIRFTTSTRSHQGVVYGRVRELNTDLPLEEVRVATVYGLSTLTDNNGYYRIQHVVQDLAFTLVAGKRGYEYILRENLHLGEGDSLEVNYILDRVGVASDDPSLPLQFALTAVYPNPFNQTTTIRYSLPRACRVKLTIADIAGRKVAELWNGNSEAGYHSAGWEANGLPSGLFIVRLEAGGLAASRKLALIK